MAAFGKNKNWLRRLLVTPADELSKRQYQLRYLAEVLRHGYRRLRENRASQMAAALAFRTIFGLVPVLIIVILIFRAFGGAEVFGDFLERVLESANLESVRSPDATMTLAEWFRQVVTDIDGKISGKAIGLVGALVLAWAAIGLLTMIERSFNTICQAPEHRSLGRRIPLYWTMLTIGPALLYLSFHFKTRFVNFVVTSGFAGPFGKPIALVTSFLSVWLLLVVFYLLVPNNRMKYSAVAGGALLAALLWTLATSLFGSYISWSFGRENSNFAILYGSLGLVPLFMLWVYFLWVVVLFGLEVAHVVQTVGKRLSAGLPVRTESSGVVDPTAVVQLMKSVSESFASGDTATAAHLTEVTGIAPATVELMLTALCDRGFLHRIDDSVVALARPAESISTSELIDLAQSLSSPMRDGDSGTAEWVERFRAAQRSMDVHRPLAEI